MFKTEESLLKQDSSLFKDVDKNYVLKVNDKFKFKVYTNNGERIIDPNQEFLRNVVNSGQQSGMNSNMREEKSVYLVAVDGRTKFPMIGWSETEGKSIFELEQNLQDKFSEYYVDVFVDVQVANRRVFVFSKDGGEVVTLENENMSLIEVLALAGIGEKGSNMQEISVIRGNLNDPEVQKINLSTIDGLKKSNLVMQSNDIIYVKPTRNAALETVRDIMPITSAISTLITTVILILNLQK